MLTREEIEGFLDRLAAEGANYEIVEEGTWRVKPSGALDFDVVIHHSPPVVLLRVKVMNLPSEAKSIAVLSRRLLELNASDLVHGSYGISGEQIVLTEALELSHLDYEEFLAAYDGMTLALAAHLPELATFKEAR